MGDKKRRPKSYKTSKTKPFTEVLRDLIGTQMNLLEQLNEFNSDVDATHVNANKKRTHSTDSSMSLDDDSKSSSIHKKKSSKKKKKKSKKSKSTQAAI